MFSNTVEGVSTVKSFAMKYAACSRRCLFLDQFHLLQLGRRPVNELPPFAIRTAGIVPFIYINGVIAKGLDIVLNVFSRLCTVKAHR